MPCKKNQICIRIPRELDCRLGDLVEKIGISKPAFILGLIYRELESKSDKNFLPEDKIKGAN